MKKVRFSWGNDRVTYLWPDHPLVIAGSKPLDNVIYQLESNVDVGSIAQNISTTFNANIKEVQSYINHIFNTLQISGISSSIEEKNQDIKSSFSDSDSLAMATLNLTRKCNLKCTHCYTGSKVAYPKKEMTIGNIQSIIIALSKLLKHKPRLLVISGGEPTLEEDKLKIVILTARKYGLIPRLNTNGCHMSDQLAKFLSSQGVLVQISVDGVDAKTHAFLRRDESTFDKAILTIKRLVNNNCRVRISFTSHALNAHQIPDMIDLAQCLGAEQFITSNLVKVGEASKNNLKTIDYDQEFTILYNAIKSNPERQLMTRSTLLAETINAIRAGVRFTYCGTGCCTCCIDSDGSLYPCINMMRSDYYIGNVNQSNLNHLWESSTILKGLRNLNIDTMNTTCSKCIFRYFCGGFCRGETLESGSEISAPYTRCQSWKKGLIQILNFLSETPELYNFGEDVYLGVLHRE